MKVLGVLQNQWFKNPARVQEYISRYGERYRDDITRFALFQGCLTGRRLVMYIGDEVKDWMWANASPVIAGRADANPPPDPDYVSSVLVRLRPDLVVAFGRNAQLAVGGSVWSGPLLVGPHPAARGRDALAALASLGATLRAAGGPLAGRTATGGPQAPPAGEATYTAPAARQRPRVR